MPSTYSPWESEVSNEYLGNPLGWQRSGYDESGIRTVLPPELRHTQTPEEEQAAYDEDLKRQTAEVELENRKISQQTALDKLTYEKNVLKQGNDFLKEIKSLNPGDPNYTLHRASLIERMPLAVEHASVKYQLGNLDKTDDGLRQNKANVEEHMRQSGVTQKQQDLTKAREIAAKMGSRYLNQFQETIKNNPDADAISVVAQIYDAQEEQKSIAELRRHEVPDTEINKFRIPEVDANGKATGRTVFNKEAADNYLKTFPTTSNMNALTGQRIRLRKELSDTEDPDIKKQIQEDLDATTRSIERFNQKLGDVKTGKDLESDRSADKAPATANYRFKSKTTAPTEQEPTKKPVEEITEEDIQEILKKRKAKAENEAALREQQTAQAAYNW